MTNTSSLPPLETEEEQHQEFLFLISKGHTLPKEEANIRVERCREALEETGRKKGWH